MKPSLVSIRKRLAPAALLLVLLMLLPASTHVARGLVLCIGEGHVGVEAAGPSHHETRTDLGAAASGALGDHIEEVFTAATEKSSDCLDLSIGSAQATDVCHQAVKGDLPDVEALSLSQPAIALGPGFSADRPRRPAGAHAPFPSSPASLSTVVLLI